MKSYVKFLIDFCLYHYTFEVSRCSHYRGNRRTRIVLSSCIVFIFPVMNVTSCEFLSK